MVPVYTIIKYIIETDCYKFHFILPNVYAALWKLKYSSNAKKYCILNGAEIKFLWPFQIFMQRKSSKRHVHYNIWCPATKAPTVCHLSTLTRHTYTVQVLCVPHTDVRQQWSDSQLLAVLTQWGQDKMTKISQTKCIFLNEELWISIISLKFVPKDQIKNIPLVHIIACHWPGDMPWSEPMMVSLLTHPVSMSLPWYCSIYLRIIKYICIS